MPHKTYQHQQGFVMPIVIVFLFISHVIYLGLLQVNQLQVTHYQWIQSHYQFSIQHLIRKQVLAQFHTANAAAFTTHLTHKIADLTQAQFGQDTIQHILYQQHQLQLIEVQQMPNTLVLIEPELYVSDAFVAFFSEASALQLYGKLDATYQFHTDATVSKERERIQATLFAEHYHYTETLRADYQSHWTTLDPPIHTLSYNTGSITIQPKQDHLILHSTRSNTNFQQQQTEPKITGNYLIRWHAYIYQKLP